MSDSANIASRAGKSTTMGMWLNGQWPSLLTVMLFLYYLPSAAASAKTSSVSPEKHWSFVPIGPVNPPLVGNGQHSENPIDAFISTKLRELKIKQVDRASKVELVRRVTYDLTGLLPTTSDLKEFLADHSARAWDKVVDRLLASSAFGERWAQHWLDLAHYADSNGFELDADRPDAWRYRDWVISSFNNDMPYDRFITLQISGDESAPGDRAALIASGFARSGPREVVGGNIDPEVRRQNELVEATATVGSVVLGLTIGCARCHDHKFDPLPTTDYYSLEAFFAGTQLKDLPINDKSEKETFDREMELIHTRIKPLEEAKAKLEVPYRERILKQKEATLTAREREIRAKPKNERTPEEARLFEGISVALKVGWEEVAAAVAQNSVDHQKRESIKRQIYEIERHAPKPPPEAMAMIEESIARPETWVLKRGNIKNKRTIVDPRQTQDHVAKKCGSAAICPHAHPNETTHS
ncbi:MAG: hypothetical protein JWM99_4901, partial [Verrucomicrobiales bacterium]|nr:hypothetical protein [Verrucomicrobiales bacterium]